MAGVLQSLASSHVRIFRRGLREELKDSTGELYHRTTALFLSVERVARAS